MLYLCIKIHCYGIRRKENRKSVRNYLTLHNRAAHSGHFARLRYWQGFCSTRKGKNIHIRSTTSHRYPTSGKGCSFSITTAQIICTPCSTLRAGVCFSIHIHYICIVVFPTEKIVMFFFPTPPHCEMRRVFLSLPNKSDKEYGTSQPPTTLQNLRYRNH